MVTEQEVESLRWVNAALELLDQRLLPHQVHYVVLQDAAAVAEAIRNMVVRGAPAIGVSAAYGAALSVAQHYAVGREDWREAVERDLILLLAARPTAVNLSWAITRVRDCLATSPDHPPAAVLELAVQIHHQDLENNRCMGDLGAALISPGSSVMTHCNAGALATAGYGTALGVIRSAHSQGKLKQVFANETRPWLQGARLTAWELLREGIDVSLIADGAAAWALSRGDIQWVIVGADRIAANGDVANKIGTYSLAVAAQYHQLGFMVVAPTSTIDLDCESGADIPIEERAKEEILSLNGYQHAAPGADAWNPVFDITPAALVQVLVTEKGTIEHPNRDQIRALMKSP
jgi:methylthioribose-1-phosphate isomerase